MRYDVKKMRNMGEGRLIKPSRPIGEFSLLKCDNVEA